MMNIILLLGAMLGLTSVMMAAFADHYLALHLSVIMLTKIATAVKYHQLYAVLITMLGIAIPLQTTPSMRKGLQCAAMIFIIGLLCFSGGIYSAVILGIGQLIYLTPLGGILLMLAWVVMAGVGIFSMR